MERRSKNGAGRAISLWRFAAAALLKQLEHLGHVLADRRWIGTNFHLCAALLLGFFQFAFELFAFVAIEGGEIIIPGFWQRDSRDKPACGM